MAEANAIPEDDRFVQAFESCALPKEMFHHRDHIRLAWIYVRSMDFAAACDRMGASILRFATHHGAVRKYHATITLAWMCLVRAASENSPEVETFDGFAISHPELLNVKTLEMLYSAELLASEEARLRWVAPDRQPLPGCITPAI